MMSNELKAELKGIVGHERFLDEKEDLLLYSYDAFMVKGQPDVVLFPITTEEVSKIMKVASREKIPVTARGAATNLTGGSVPTQGGIALIFTKMNKILEIDKENRVAVVQPGVVNMDFQKELAKQRSLLSSGSGKHGRDDHGRKRGRKCGRSQGGQVRCHQRLSPRDGGRLGLGPGFADGLERHSRT